MCEMEKRLLFPGCLVLARFQDYELATKAVLKRLGIELVDMQEFCCCSSSIVPSVSDDWINLSAYNLGLAEARGQDIVTICGSCTRTLKLANQALESDKQLLEKVNRRLAEVGAGYRGTVKVNHLIEVLDEKRVLIEKLKKKSLDYRVALTHPCNVVRPSAVVKFDDPWEPQKMREVLQAAGVEVVDYALEDRCCGSTLLMVNEELALDAGKLLSAIKAGADAMVVACGNCYMLLERYQHKMREKNPDVSLPVMFLPQVLGEALALSPEEMGMELA